MVGFNDDKLCTVSLRGHINLLYRSYMLFLHAWSISMLPGIACGRDRAVGFNMVGLVTDVYESF